MKDTVRKKENVNKSLVSNPGLKVKPRKVRFVGSM